MASEKKPPNPKRGINDGKEMGSVIGIGAIVPRYCNFDANRAGKEAEKYWNHPCVEENPYGRRRWEP